VKISNNSHKFMDEQKLKYTVSILTQVINRKLTAKKAASLLDVTIRSVFRKLARYKEFKEAGLVHGLSGRPSNNRFPDTIRSQFLKLASEEYRDARPSQITELLKNEHGITVSRETVRKWMIEAGLRQPGLPLVPRSGQGVAAK
jgi:transposase